MVCWEYCHLFEVVILLCQSCAMSEECVAVIHTLSWRMRCFTDEQLTLTDTEDMTFHGWLTYSGYPHGLVSAPGSHWLTYTQTLALIVKLTPYPGSCLTGYSSSDTTWTSFKGKTLLHPLFTSDRALWWNNYSLLPFIAALWQLQICWLVASVSNPTLSEPFYLSQTWYCSAVCRTDPDQLTNSFWCWLL